MGVGQETLLATVALVPLSVESKLFSPDPVFQNHWLRTQFCFMSPMKSRSNSPAMNEDSVKRDQRSSSVPDEYNSEIKRTVVSRSRSITRSRSRSRSRGSLSRDRRDRSRSRSRRRARSRSRGGSRGRRYRSRSRSPRRSRSPEENRLHV